MKMQIRRLLVLSSLCFTIAIPLSTCFAQGTAFTYQGRLNSGGAPASGSFDLTFTLFAASTNGVALAGPVTNSATAVTNGLFITAIDFGPGVFTGGSNWLEIAVRTNGSGSFTTLSPRQRTTPAPYALFAEGVNSAGISGAIPAANLAGAYTNQVTLTNSGNSYTGSGSGLTGVNAVALNGLGASNFWQTAGNAGTTPGANFVGTTDNQPLELHVNGQRALRLEPNSSGAPNVIGGSPLNYVSNGVYGATIAGGGSTNYGGVAYSNSVSAIFGTIGGGFQNEAGGQYGATVSGGFFNSANGAGAFIGGGALNFASGGGATIGGGQNNTNTAGGATIAGGEFNAATGPGAFIGGGGFDAHTFAGNVASGAAVVIGGGMFNQATNIYAVVGGGTNNLGGGVASTVGGGFDNLASGYGSTIGGGGDDGLGDKAGNLASGAASTVGGGTANTATNYWATVAGGAYNHAYGSSATVGGGAGNLASGSEAVIAGGGPNYATNYLATVGGGSRNIAGGVGSFVGGGGYDGTTQAGNQATGVASVIGGGLGNNATYPYATVGGGEYNTASGFSVLGSNFGATTVAGGEHNTASLNDTTVGGGADNTASGSYATVAGGYQNTASGGYATIAGGGNNTASGSDSFAAGYGAAAMHSGSFVWSDGETYFNSGDTVQYSSDRANQFKIQAGGGVLVDVSGSSGLNPAAFQINSTSGNGVGLYVANTTSSDATAVFTAGGTGIIIKGFGSGGEVFDVYNSGDVYGKSFNSTSDRNAKENFSTVSPTEVLARVAALPISEWNFKTEPADQRHLGPMAQDFHAAFGLNGGDDKHISTVDEGGVALAAIQGLNEKVEDRSQKSEDRIQKLEAQNAELKQQLNQLTRVVNELNQKLKGGAQ